MVAPVIWLTATAAAAHLGISVRHLARLRQRGDIIAYQLGRSGRLRYRQQDLDQLFRQRDQATLHGEAVDLAAFISHRTTRGVS